MQMHVSWYNAFDPYLIQDDTVDMTNKTLRFLIDLPGKAFLHE